MNFHRINDAEIVEASGSQIYSRYKRAYKSSSDVLNRLSQFTISRLATDQAASFRHNLTHKEHMSRSLYGCHWDH